MTSEDMGQNFSSDGRHHLEIARRQKVAFRPAFWKLRYIYRLRRTSWKVKHQKADIEDQERITEMKGALEESALLSA